MRGTKQNEKKQNKILIESCKLQGKLFCANFRACNDTRSSGIISGIIISNNRILDLGRPIVIIAPRQPRDCKVIVPKDNIINIHKEEFTSTVSKQ